MTVIRNTLEKIYDVWKDPGDYPSGAGGSKKPRTMYLSEVAGSVEIMYDAATLKLLVDEDYTIRDMNDFISEDFMRCYRHANCTSYKVASEVELDPPVSLHIDAILLGRQGTVSFICHFEIMKNV